ncbi:MAG: hypothetical protein HFJ51_04205 [Clostridia bacterium]|nr:hypothetical protein [Clostridia bacterium]
MTKKGVILIIVLVILLSTITILVTVRHREIKEEVSRNLISDSNSIIYKEDEFAFDITNATDIDLEKLKGYELPIIIQFGSRENEICADMLSSLEKLNKNLRGRAIIKYLDTDKYAELWKEPLVPFEEDAMQLLINNDGTPYNTDISEAFGYKLIKNEAGEHIYTIHDGDLTLSNMEEILNNMIVK